MSIQTHKTPAQRIDDLEAHLKTLPQVDLNTTHTLSGGMYARTIYIPAGTTMTGATHKFDHLDVMQGDVSFTLGDGTISRLTGHHVLATKAGAKRAGYVHTDTIWTTICATQLDNIADIENELVVESADLQTRQLELAGTHTYHLEK